MLVLFAAPVLVAVQVNGSGYASDIYRDLVAAFNILQGGNITVISRKCLLEPLEPNYSTCFLLGDRAEPSFTFENCRDEGSVSTGLTGSGLGFRMSAGSGSAGVSDWRICAARPTSHLCFISSRERAGRNTHLSHDQSGPVGSRRD